MKLTKLCLILVVLTRGSSGLLGPPERSYKILMLLPVATKSHGNVFFPLAEALADRGHEIVMLTNFPKSSKHPIITEITHDLPYFKFENINMFGAASNVMNIFTKLSFVAREMYHVPAVKEFYQRRKEFDLMVVDAMFNEVAYPFVHNVPFITLFTSATNHRVSAVLGNVLNPAYVPFMDNFHFPASVWQRLLNTVHHISYPFFWRIWSIVPTVQKEISAQFPELPPLLDLERNMSLTLINGHFSTGIPLPLLPSQVEVGGMHCRPASPLPQDLESWIIGAGSAGVVYFSLGSVARGTSVPVKYRDFLIEAFRRLPQRVLWKHEEELENLPDNVMINKWLPQQDILAHHNVKVFISHCGFLSLQEAIYHATPLLALPIYSDQPRNAKLMRDAGLGLMLVWEELTVDLIVDALTDIINDPKYKENVIRKSVRMRDQLTSPRERAVFWTEYVIRHRGAPQLRSPAAQLSWVEFLMLDILLLLLLALSLLLFILHRIFRIVTTILFSGDGRKKKSD
ncbi:UDP-glycosyltransferase UGT5 isoform X1 [Procambarus clarkii]|uniref:UDP-glycosyltransferase UGT5 isoform X1 n=1 Tax=Procambarus clarkii TaxID=6728 RepID=UPI003743222D